ncbi:bifunctional glutamate N-acetyltransferase/amino-acid acetyltransferase ArgJ [bacterium]|nr:bifunctional glutamate N-acetyltransferase/amino-acid acetyltransferase ArgJ [bacterium]
MKIIEKGTLTLVRGIKASGIHCGLKTGKKDLALIFSESPATAAGVYTRNKIVAAPVLVTKENLSGYRAQAIIINSGIANSATGKKGIEDARRMASVTANALNIPPEYVIVASTGRIGNFLPMEKISSGISLAVNSLSEKGGDSAAEAILTTDTFSKTIAVQLDISGLTVTLAGMAKGAGMIRPDMATMLAFLVTDASFDVITLRSMLSNAVEKTFNRITVDGDTSTNDMVIIMANTLSGIPSIMQGSSEMFKFVEALEYVCHELALMIVRDGEGATKQVNIRVIGAHTQKEAARIAFRIAESPLVKTSIYGRSCNWGRVIAAVGMGGVPIDPEKIDINYGPYQVVQNGMSLGQERENEAADYLRSKQINIIVNLNLGKEESSVWTTDLSPEYIHINADYIT